jgi:hypothetical protein
MIGVLRVNGQSDLQLRGSRCRRDVKRATARVARRFTTQTMRDVKRGWDHFADDRTPPRFTRGYES